MLNVTGKVRIMDIIDKSDKVVKAKIYFGTKNRNEVDVWDSNFFNAVLVGNAHKKSFDLNEKDDIFITQGLVTNKNYTGKDGIKKAWLEVAIFDFVTGEDIEKELAKYSNDTPKGTSKEDKPKPRSGARKKEDKL